MPAVKTILHHPKCMLQFDAHNGDFDCGYGTLIACADCKYGGFGGKKDPEAKCNRLQKEKQDDDRVLRQ